ncbi:hypothetical protein BDZ89DRAFT_1058344 [Hymenopellis radicata]|nr:hypothetical protein BDZ89DRAFT_1058344 [Hymenopellis radicata]
MSKSGIQCQDCSDTFENADPSQGLVCFKCLELEAANGDEAKIQVIQKKPQCGKCGHVYKFLSGDTCKPCMNRTEVTTGNSPRRVVTKSGVPEPKGPAKRRQQQQPTPTRTRETVHIEDSEDDDIIMYDPKPDTPVSIMHDIINTKRQEVSQRRLTPKDPQQATAAYLEKKTNLIMKRTSASKVAPISFWVTPKIATAQGKKTGTRVPPESRPFQIEQNLSVALDKLVKLFNEVDSQWLQEFPGKKIDPSRVIWTFEKGGAAIKNHNGGYMTAADVKARAVKLVMQIRHEDVQDDIGLASDEDEDEDVNSSPPSKRRRKLQSRDQSSKRIKVKKEKDTGDDQVPLVKQEDIDNEPKATLPSAISLLRPVTFSVMRYNDSSEFETVEEREGSLRVMPIESDAFKHTFKLMTDRVVYHAYRFQSADLRFDIDGELIVAQAQYAREILLGKALTSMLNELRALESPPEIPAIHIPSPENMFLALTYKEKTLRDVYLCMLESDTGSEGSRFDEDGDFLEALSHYSFMMTSHEQVLVDTKVLFRPDGSFVLQHPTTHSLLGESGLGDLGKAGIDFSKDLHVCDNRFCHPLRLHERAKF